MKNPLSLLALALSLLLPALAYSQPALEQSRRLDDSKQAAVTQPTTSKPLWQWVLGSAVLVGALAAGWLIKPLALPVREIGGSGPGKKESHPPISA